MMDDPTFSLLSFAMKLYRFFDFPKNSIFGRVSPVLIKEIAIILPVKIRSPNCQIMPRMVIMISLLGRVRIHTRVI